MIENPADAVTPDGNPAGRDAGSFTDRLLESLSNPSEGWNGEIPSKLPVRLIEVPAGTPVFLQGDPGIDIFVIKEGKVRTYLKSGKVEQTVAILGPGDLFGELALLGADNRCVNAVAVENSRVICVDKDSFLKLVPQEPARQVILRLTEKLRDATALLGAPLFDDPLCRFIYGLIYFHRRNTPGNGGNIDLAELKDLFKLDSMTQIRKYLAKLEALQILRFSENNVYVDNSEKLNNILEMLSGERKLTLKL
jgi:CRP-like cAMP-binding protein